MISELQSKKGHIRHVNCRDMTFLLKYFPYPDHTKVAFFLKVILQNPAKSNLIVAFLKIRKNYYHLRIPSVQYFFRNLFLLLASIY